MENQQCKNKCGVLYRTNVPDEFSYYIKKDIIKNLNILTCDAMYGKGCIYFLTNDFAKVKLLRSIDNIHIVVDSVKLHLTGNKQQDLNEISRAVFDIDISEYIEMWAEMSQFAGLLVPHPPLKYDFEFAYLTELQEYYAKNMLRFKVTCTRSGNHSFNSGEAAARFGGIIAHKYQWPVSLENFNLNIVFDIDDDEAEVCLQIPKEQLENRFVYDLGRPSIRPTIAYTMLRLAKMQPGHIVVDPICNCGSIAMECLFACPNVALIFGDIRNKETEALLAKSMYEYTNLPKPSVLIWSNMHLPLPDNSVDAIISYLPYKKRKLEKPGQMYDNFNREFSRVVKRKTGRIVLLTKDIKNIFLGFELCVRNSKWKLRELIEFNARNTEHALIVARRK